LRNSCEGRGKVALEGSWVLLSRSARKFQARLARAAVGDEVRLDPWTQPVRFFQPYVAILSAASCVKKTGVLDTRVRVMNPAMAMAHAGGLCPGARVDHGRPWARMKIFSDKCFIGALAAQSFFRAGPGMRLCLSMNAKNGPMRSGERRTRAPSADQYSMAGELLPACPKPALNFDVHVQNIGASFSQPPGNPHHYRRMAVCPEPQAASRSTAAHPARFSPGRNGSVPQPIRMPGRDQFLYYHLLREAQIIPWRCENFSERTSAKDAIGPHQELWRNPALTKVLSPPRGLGPAAPDLIARRAS